MCVRVYFIFLLFCAINCHRPFLKSCIPHIHIMKVTGGFRWTKFALLAALVLQVSAARDPGFNGKQIKTDKGIEYIFEAPEEKPSRILLLAHGCAHSARDFWPANPQCPNCVGLPEERRIVTKALIKGYFVVAVSSAGQDHGGCWDIRLDSKRVMRVLGLVKKSDGALRALPVFALGVSSGGAMVAALANRLPDLAGLCIQVMAPDISFQMAQQMFPPSQWIYMDKDQRTKKQVKLATKALAESGALVDSILAKQIPLTDTFFSDRIVEMNPAISAAIYDEFVSNNVITERGFLRADPRHSNWRASLEHMLADLKPDSLAADASPIAEEMNVAYSMHEITAEHMDDTLAFFDKAANVFLSRAHDHEYRY